MNQAYIYWLFTQQLEEQAQLARQTPHIVAERHPHNRSGWLSRLPRRRNPLGHAVPAQRAPVGCAV